MLGQPVITARRDVQAHGRALRVRSLQDRAQEPPCTLDFRRFTSDTLLECYAAERDILTARARRLPVTTNFMPLGIGQTPGPGPGTRTSSPWTSTRTPPTRTPHSTE